MLMRPAWSFQVNERGWEESWITRALHSVAHRACLCYHSIAMKRHSDQGNIKKKLIRVLLTSFTGFVHDHHGGKHSNRQAGMVLEC